MTKKPSTIHQSSVTTVTESAAPAQFCAAARIDLLSNKWPRGLSRLEAAAYIGIGVTFFDEKVAQGILPKPAELGKRRIWDRRELDAAFDTLKQGMRFFGGNPWDNQ
jgi:predicted DNA-binding transcriptional regulator AlpA